jgi:hypothetical protein
MTPSSHDHGARLKGLPVVLRGKSMVVIGPAFFQFTVLPVVASRAFEAVG